MAIGHFFRYRGKAHHNGRGVNSGPRGRQGNQLFLPSEKAPCLAEFGGKMADEDAKAPGPGAQSCSQSVDTRSGEHSRQLGLSCGSTGGSPPDKPGGNSG
jgi:hypothetical protein